METSPPTHYVLLSSLLNSLSASLSGQEVAASPQNQSNPFQQLTTSSRPLLFTLHVLYPTVLLPALDLLDRRLVERLIPQNASRQDDPQGDFHGNIHHNPQSREPLSRKLRGNFFLVKSTALSGGRFKDMLVEKMYEVRTASMWCSCPAWAVTSFSAEFELDAQGDIDGKERDITNDDNNDDNDDDIGPLLTNKGKEHLGMCKHLLACLLVERVACLANYAQNRSVSIEEFAGWAIGGGG